MRDIVPNGTGNSRSLKSSIPAGTTWEQALAMLRDGTFPVDLKGLNPEGILNNNPSAYSKANVLPDEVCDALGIDRVASEPKDALKQLGIWAKPVVGTYTGNGVTAARTINLGFQPSFLIVFRSNAGGEPTYTRAYTSECFLTVLPALNSRAAAGSGSYSYIDVTENGFTVTGSGPSGTYVDYYNKSGKTYGYIAWR